MNTEKRIKEKTEPTVTDKELTVAGTVFDYLCLLEPGDTQGDPIGNIASLIKTVSKDNGTWMGCNVCCGEPLPGGRPCICGGEGTIFAEADGLRKALYEEGDRLDNLLDAADLKRNSYIRNDASFRGYWLAIPEDDFNRLRAQVKNLRALAKENS